MKIYFEDGYLDAKKFLSFHCDHIIDAKMGFTLTEEALWKIKKYCPQNTVYTNQITALSNQWAWNEELHVPEIYLRKDKESDWVRIDKLTTRELREGYNLEKMYISGEFVKGMEEMI